MSGELGSKDGGKREEDHREYAGVADKHSYQSSPLSHQVLLSRPTHLSSLFHLSHPPFSTYVHFETLSKSFRSTLDAEKEDKDGTGGSGEICDKES